MIAHTSLGALHIAKKPDHLRFRFLDSYYDSGHDTHLEAWRKHGLRTFDEEDTAVILHVSLPTLRKWLQTGRGPKARRKNGEVVYRIGKLYDWLLAEAKRVGYTPVSRTKIGSQKSGSASA